MIENLVNEHKKLCENCKFLHPEKFKNKKNYINQIKSFLESNPQCCTIFLETDFKEFTKNSEISQLLVILSNKENKINLGCGFIEYLLTALENINIKISESTPEPKQYFNNKLTPTQLETFHWFLNNPGKSIKNYADLRDVSYAAVYEPVSILIKKGYLKKNKIKGNNHIIQVNLNETELKAYEWIQKNPGKTAREYADFIDSSYPKAYDTLEKLRDMEIIKDKWLKKGNKKVYYPKESTH